MHQAAIATGVEKDSLRRPQDLLGILLRAGIECEVRFEPRDNAIMLIFMVETKTEDQLEKAKARLRRELIKDGYVIQQED